MTPAVLHILMALSHEDLHGYGVKRAVAKQTGGRLRLGPGTLYEAIHRLEGDGWIEEVFQGPQGTGKPRRYYRTTREGRAQMEEELLRLRLVVGFAEDHDLIADTGA